jgi:quinol-cytochrome oxidoreductase complex cytochrome b subunit
MAKKGELGRVWDYIVNTQVWRSIIRHGRPNTPRNRSLAVLANLVLHLHPLRLRKSGMRVRYTWCMGGLTFFLFLELTITGLLLMFYYRPTAEYAYPDITYLRADVPLGIMRELHRWGAHAMVISVWLHMMRVFMTGAYKPPREFNWGVGVVLLLLTLLLSFTGYLLPWDQLAIWAVTVGTNMARATPVMGHEGPGAAFVVVPYANDAGTISVVHQASDVRFGLLGGRFVSAATLLRFYVLHCVAFPLVAAFLIALHFWRVRKDGGISGPL